jgi:hypothetical protein
VLRHGGTRGVHFQQCVKTEIQFALFFRLALNTIAIANVIKLKLSKTPPNAVMPFS